MERPTLAGLRIAMALYGDVTFDSRVQREAEALSRSRPRRHRCTACPARSARRHTGSCRGGRTGPGFCRTAAAPSVARTGRALWADVARIRWIAGYVRNIRAWGRWAVAAAADVDVWHVHDLTGLMAVAPLVRGPARLVYDSHEIFLETGTAARLPSAAPARPLGV